MKKLYLLVSNDRYELPVAVGETPKELGDMVGVSPHSVLSKISHGLSGFSHSCYHRIEYTEEEWDEA